MRRDAIGLAVNAGGGEGLVEVPSREAPQPETAGPMKLDASARTRGVR